MRNKTMIFILLTLLAIGAWDIYAIFVGGKEASISHILIEWSYAYPSFTFLLGYTFGHLTWRMRSTKVMKDKDIQ